MVRFFIVRNHYRSPQNYTPDNLVDAQNALDRLYQALQNVPADGQGVDWNEPQAQAFKAAMDDDFNSSGAVAACSSWPPRPTGPRAPAAPAS